MTDLLLRGGCPWGVGAPADVLIREGVIERVGPDLRADPAAEVVDVPGRLLLPGLIDALPRRQDVVRGTLGAALGRAGASGPHR